MFVYFSIPDNARTSCDNVYLHASEGIQKVVWQQECGHSVCSPRKHTTHVTHGRKLPGVEQEIRHLCTVLSFPSRGAALTRTCTSSLYRTSRREPQPRDNTGIHLRSTNTHSKIAVSEVAGSAQPVAFLLHVAGSPPWHLSYGCRKITWLNSGTV